MKKDILEGSTFKDDDDFVQFSRDFIRKHKGFLIDYIQMDEMDRRKVQAFLVMVDKGDFEVDEVQKH